MEEIACEDEVRDNARAMSCLSLTSQARLINSGTCRDGGPMLFWAHIRLTRSEICCTVGALDIEAKLTGRRLPGGSAGVCVSA